MSDNFHDVRFPARLAINIAGGPQTRVDMVQLSSGHERRNTRWSSPLRRYSLSTGTRPSAEITALVDFFEARSGPLHAFRLQDPFQSSTAQNGQFITAMDSQIGVGDGSRTVFPMTLESGRRITKPNLNSVLVGLDGSALNAGFSVDFQSGIVQFSQAPSNGAVVTIGCAFDVPVRFENEQLIISRMAEGAAEISEINLIEVRL